MYHRSGINIMNLKIKESFQTEKALSILTTLLMINFISQIEKIIINSSTKNQTVTCKTKTDFLES
jgi:hypothetical protein